VLSSKILEQSAKPQHFSTIPANINLSFCNLSPVHPDLSFLSIFFSCFSSTNLWCKGDAPTWGQLRSGKAQNLRRWGLIEIIQLILLKINSTAHSIIRKSYIGNLHTDSSFLQKMFPEAPSLAVHVSSLTSVGTVTPVSYHRTWVVRGGQVLP